MLPVDIKSDLTSKKVRELLDYNPKTGLLHWRVRASARVYPGDVAGLLIGDGYIQVTINSQRFLAHRLIWLHTTSHWPECELDHINGIKNDNRLCNLREATVAENRRNRKPHKGKKLGLKGVHQRGNKFQATIWVDGKGKNLGTFLTKEDAAKAYRRAAKHYFGEFAHRS